ncbi:hypothetical protein, conserved [Leishmania tarentolae]|uniref:Uncharacterized protein n=1 Tax=Leishmania tarentolae TaxID=5689 RepID=A0A640KGG4_LEITA|nr:hypothetical protein, conserved [Leishmania tarentolae]
MQAAAPTLLEAIWRAAEVQGSSGGLGRSAGAHAREPRGLGVPLRRIALMRWCHPRLFPPATAEHFIVGSLRRHRGCVLCGGTAQAARWRSSARVSGQGHHPPSNNSFAKTTLASSNPDDDSKVSAPSISAPPAVTSSSAACDASASAKGFLNGAASAADVLLSLNHTQRLLRRLPVGASGFLFHYNELPSNIRDKMPLVVQQNHEHRAQVGSQEQGCIPNAAAAAPVSASECGAVVSAETTPVADTPGRHSGSADYSHLLTLAQPQLTASEKTAFALFRGAQKERQLVRQQRLKEQQERFVMEGGGGRSSATSRPAPPLVTDPLLHLRDLEEPCLLIPNTRGAFASLGLAVDVHCTADTPTSFISDRATATTASTAAARALPLPSPLSPSSDTRRAVNAAANRDMTAMDRFHLGLTCISTDYRTDYATLPLYYVLGVPTALLDLLQSTPSTNQEGFHDSKIRDEMIDGGACKWRNRCQSPVDLSRWLVFDIATSQVLLRRCGVACTYRPPVPHHVSTLETHVFLAQTYSFDPRAAYEAAVLQARVPAQPSASTAGSSASASVAALPTMQTLSPPLYTLFFFTVVRGQRTTNSGVSPINAGALYPTCFSSYMSEVPTTHQLAAETAEAAQQLCFQRGDTSQFPMPLPSATGPGAADNSSFFVSISGKRLRACADGTSSTSPNLWAAQLQSRKLGAIGGSATEPLPSNFATQETHKTTLYRSEAGSSALRDQEGRGSWRQTTALQEMAESFRVWREAVAARVPVPPLCRATCATTFAEDHRSSGTPPPMTDGEQRPPAPAPAPSPHPEHPQQRSKPTGSAPWLSASYEQGREQTHRSHLEEQLDIESAALMSEGGTFSQEWSTGFRFGRVAIEVAVPLLFPMSAVMTDVAATPFPLPVAPPGAQTGGADATIDAPVHVMDAPLADTLWSALYTPAVTTSASPMTPSGSFSSPPPFSTTPAAAAAEAVMTSILPMAEERLMLARERVLLPFLLYQPRWVLPASDSLGELPSSLSRVSDTGNGQRTGCGRNRQPPVNVCPSLWRLHELEQICGWRCHRFSFSDVFGSFSGLLTHDLYTMMGRRTPGMLPASISKTRFGARQADGPRTPLSPTVLLNDAVYVERVLLPAMQCFAVNTCTWVNNSLCVYRSPYKALPAERRSQTSLDDEPADSPAETAAAVALHHRQMSIWLQQLQRIPHELLRRWVADCHGRTSLDPALDARVRRRTGGVPATCLMFFVGVCSGARPALSSRPARTSHGGDDDNVGESGAVAASADAIDKGLERLLSLTPDRIAVVPLLDFVVWGSLCSDFSAASMQHFTYAAGRCRASLDAPADGLSTVKYCVRYPRHLCCNGGRGTTVALVR